AHHHRALDGLAASEELGLGEHLAAPTGVTALAAALTLGLEPGRSAQRGDLVGARAARVVRVPRAARTASATTTAAARGLVVPGVVGRVCRVGLLVVVGVLRRLGVVRAPATGAGALAVRTLVLRAPVVRALLVRALVVRALAVRTLAASA